jgi:hypothetical protein
MRAGRRPEPQAYPACRFTHAPIDLALELHRRGLSPQDIKQVRIRVSGQAVNMVGRRFDAQTAGVVDAQFSIAYTVAVGIHTGALRIADFTEEAIRDARIGAFAADKITDRSQRPGALPRHGAGVLRGGAGQRPAHRARHRAGLRQPGEAHERSAVPPRSRTACTTTMRGSTPMR